jgi:hypothetical protein
LCHDIFQGHSTQAGLRDDKGLGFLGSRSHTSSSCIVTEYPDQEGQEIKQKQTQDHIQRETTSSQDHCDKYGTPANEKQCSITE